MNATHLIQRITDFMIDVLLSVQEKLVSEERFLDQNNWGIWVVNTKTNVAVIAACDVFWDDITNDGNFVGGALIQSGLSERAARVKISEISSKFSKSKDIDRDLN